MVPAPYWVPDANISLPLSEGQFVDQCIEKSMIVLHHTVGGTARSSIDWWKQDPSPIGTAFVIERDGTVYQTFDASCWAYHLGLKRVPKGSVDMRSIGIEIASEGGLVEREGKLYCYDRITPRTLHTDPSFDCGQLWRGYRYFDAYSPQQMESVLKLVALLIEHYAIPKATPRDHLAYSPLNVSFRGIVGHHQLRQDKSDIHPGFPWDRLVSQCQLSLV